MLLLVTDTSGKNGFVALARADESAQAEQVAVIEEIPLAGGTFSAQLVPQISGLLENHRFKKTDIGAFIVVSGPGSFTGLRVGLAAIKALAEILQKPIVPISLLEVVALSGGKPGKLLAALDAGRGEVYVGEYDVNRESANVIGERWLAKEVFLEEARGSWTATPDPGLAAALRAAGIPAVEVDAPAAGRIARLGYQKLTAGLTVSPEQLEANYIRRSDAEVFAKTGF